MLIQYNKNKMNNAISQRHSNYLTICRLPIKFRILIHLKSVTYNNSMRCKSLIFA